jgi:hypothetical protein
MSMRLYAARKTEATCKHEINEEDVTMGENASPY